MAARHMLLWKIICSSNKQINILLKFADDTDFVVPQMLLFLMNVITCYHTFHAISYSSCNSTSATTLSFPQLAFFRLQILSRLKTHIFTVLSTLASSTSSPPSSFSIRQWRNPRHDRAPGIQLFYRFY